MLRASSLLSLPAALAFTAAATAIELPVIYNGTQVAAAPNAAADPPAATGKVELPTIINYPSAAFPKTDGKPPAAPKATPVRVVVAYDAGDYMTPVSYNAYGAGPMLGIYEGMGYNMAAPYGLGFGNYGGYGYGGYGYGYGGYGPGFGLATTLVDLRPPRVEVLDTGVRANVGRLASTPSVAAPVFGEVMAVYYR